MSFFVTFFFLFLLRQCLFMRKDFKVCLYEGCGLGTTRYTNKARQNWGHVLPPVTNNTAASEKSYPLSHSHTHVTVTVATRRSCSIQEAVHRSHDLDDHRHSLVYRSVRSPVRFRGIVDAGADVLRRSGHTLGTSPGRQRRRGGRRGEALI